MKEQEIKTIVERQRACFQAGKTLNIDVRIEALKKLRVCVQKYEKEIAAALKKDLGKSAMESYMCETGMVWFWL